MPIKMNFRNFAVPYQTNEQYSKRVAYFSMEFAVHNALKIYSGGLGFLAGSHMRSAYELKQNLIGVGILWKYGYYDQARNQDQTLQVTWMEKIYSFLEDPGIKFQILIHEHPVWVKAYYLNPDTFQTAPLFLLSTDLAENDYVSQTICHRLYDANVATKIAQFILLGVGGAKLIDEIGFNPDLYHLNEAHGISSAFYLLKKFKSVDMLRRHLVFTTHTPEEAGNEKHDIYLCHKMSYFGGLSIDEVRRLTGIQDDQFNHSLTALRFAKLANAVSQLHGRVSREMWSKYENICPIISITNAQNWKFWADKQLYKAHEDGNDAVFDDRKKYLKRRSFYNHVADQTGKLLSPDKLTIAWARRFAGYKRADLITQNMERFNNLVNNTKYPVQIIWAGKPYPVDYPAISQFNHLVHLSKNYKNVAVLIGYELWLSKRLKQAADVWLNNPRVPREASGTSGMTAAMNGAVNFSTDDGWIPEFINHGNNGFLIPKADQNANIHDQDEHDLNCLYEILEKQILPLYYDNYDTWRQIIKNGMRDVRFQFDSNRMAHEYYVLLYK